MASQLTFYCSSARKEEGDEKSEYVTVIFSLWTTCSFLKAEQQRNPAVPVMQLSSFFFPPPASKG